MPSPEKRQIERIVGNTTEVITMDQLKKGDRFRMYEDGVLLTLEDCGSMFKAVSDGRRREDGVGEVDAEPLE